MPCVPAVSQQRAHEEAAPPHSTSRLQHGDPWLGWGQQGLPEEEPPHLLSPGAQPSWPGLLSPRVTHPELERLERWASIRNSGGTPSFQRLEALGPPLEGSPPPRTNNRKLIL
ncbi:unnamed protein product [Pipistrellus nathusii]|uniref:Uncharacterized protein n=1 Tax=Pipistrellus nathusii TaxID=59473 RepID=A0ABP0AGI4_PIPNA